MAQAAKADYGIDAPGVVRNLAIAGGALLLVAGAVVAGLLPREAGWQNSSGGGIRLALLPPALTAGLSLSLAACWMYFGSKYGKLGEREKLLDRIEWTGSEDVLDVGCGRGLILVGAARRLKSGKAVGVDIWQAEDLSGNRAEVPLRNAAAEGVADRVSVNTADMRRLPFPDASFDVVVSRAAIHNLYSPADRAVAIGEIARVLRPGGRAVIADIRHFREYERAFQSAGGFDVRSVDSRLAAAFTALYTLGTLRPHTMVVKKNS